MTTDAHPNEQYALVGWATFEVSTTHTHGVKVFKCQRCGALIDQLDIELHDGWHDSMQEVRDAFGERGRSMPTSGRYPTTDKRRLP